MRPSPHSSFKGTNDKKLQMQKGRQNAPPPACCGLSSVEYGAALLPPKCFRLRILQHLRERRGFARAREEQRYGGYKA